MRQIVRGYLHATDSDPDTTPAQVDDWHRQRGWREIGYHAQVYLKDGAWVVETTSRKLEEAGAHVAGDNAKTWGLVIAGRYDEEPPPEEALELAAECFAAMCFAHDLDPMTSVLGHREGGDVPYVPPTDKTCPGAAVDLDAFRLRVVGHLDLLREIEAR